MSDLNGLRTVSTVLLRSDGCILLSLVSSPKESIRDNGG